MPICDGCTRWLGQEPLSISAMKAEMADRHRRGEAVGQGARNDLFLFPYAIMATDFSPSDYALFDAATDVSDFEGDDAGWEGS